MARVDVGYRKDLPATVRVQTKFAPFESFSPDEARKFAEELLKAALEVEIENAKRGT